MSDGLCCICVTNDDTGEDVSRIDCRRPCWEGIYSGYHKGIDDAEFAMSIGYSEKNLTAEEISAIRVSVALMESDMMRDALNTGIGNPRAVDMVKAGPLSGNKFIKNINELKNWLSNGAIWKKPEEMKWVNAVKTIDGRNGVIIISSDPGYTFNVRAYATLWDGDKNDIVECGSRGIRYFEGSDNVCFWELVGTGADLNVEKHEVHIVIDRYKMPGLNEDGTDIADDMCYGMLDDAVSLPIYDKKSVTTYREEYQKKGFDKIEHKVFSNDNVIVSKRRYDINEVSKIFNIEETMKKDSTVLFKEFRDMAINDFTVSRLPNMQANILEMIQRFENKKGGIYENLELTNYIKGHPSTRRYCDELTEYIKSKLDGKIENISKLEDIEVYWKIKDKFGKYSLNMTKRYRGEHGKTFSLTPQYSGVSSIWQFFSEEEQRNTIEGVAIAVGDIWATEVVITRYELDKCEKKYTIRYKVTMWDHFGLNIEDLVGRVPLFEGFKAWFVLQHFRGFKPFITKIEFANEFNWSYK